MSDANPALFILFQIAATMFILMAIAKMFKADFDKLSIVIIAGLSLFLSFFVFWIVEVIAAGFVLSLLFRLWHASREPRLGPFVPPELDEERGIQDEREE